MNVTTIEDLQRLETERNRLRQALEDIASTGRALVQVLPVNQRVPVALAQGPLLTLAGIAEAALAVSGEQT